MCAVIMCVVICYTCLCIVLCVVISFSCLCVMCVCVYVQCGVKGERGGPCGITVGMRV